MISRIVDVVLFRWELVFDLGSVNVFDVPVLPLFFGVKLRRVGGPVTLEQAGLACLFWGLILGSAVSRWH